jgi:catechol 2,3-dioxygenase-like lactoylglutathione lyase family enzyme
MRKVTGLLESALYVDDLVRSAAFYQSLFGFETLLHGDRLIALSVSGRQVLLLFQKGMSNCPLHTPGGVIPPHQGAGQLHLAFSVPEADLPAWESRLGELGIPIESRVRWELGGQSIYFRDPDEHSVELVTPGCWRIY